MTGSTYFNPELAAKRLELLKEAMPGLMTMIAYAFLQYRRLAAARRKKKN